MKRLDWIALATGLVSFWVLVFQQRWGAAAAIGVISAVHVHTLLRRWGR